MAIINGIQMPNFEEHEFSEDPALYANITLLKNLQLYRDSLGKKIFPSQASGALARFDGRKKSMHFVRKQINRETLIDEDYPAKNSKAIDIFCECLIFEAWTIALSSGLFNGVGVYFDTKNNYGRPQPMLHLDLRPLPLIWFRDNGKYFYPHKNYDFFRNLMKLFEIQSYI